MKVAQSCPTLFDSVDCSPWNSLSQNSGVGSISLLQAIFPTQGSNPGIPHCRRILYQLSHQGSPGKIKEAYEITWEACGISITVEYPVSLPFFVVRMKTEVFQSCGHCWVFQMCWHIECSTLTASSYRFSNSSPGIS